MFDPLITILPWGDLFHFGNVRGKASTKKFIALILFNIFCKQTDGHTDGRTHG